MLLLNAVELYAIRDRFGLRDRLMENISYAWSEADLLGCRLPLEPEEIWTACVCIFDAEQMGDVLCGLYDGKGDIVEENLHAVIDFACERTKKLIRARNADMGDEEVADAAACAAYALYVVLTDEMSRRLLTQPLHPEIQQMVKKNVAVRSFVSALDRVKGIAQRCHKYHLSDYRHIGHEVLHTMRLANLQTDAFVARTMRTRTTQA